MNILAEFGMFTWTPSRDILTNPDLMYQLQIQATNEMGATALYWPTIKLCACNSAIQCDWIFMNNQELQPSQGTVA